MHSIEVEITGTAPLLMHRFSDEARDQIESRSSRVSARITKEETAERGAYRMPGNNGSGNLCLPAENLMGAMRRAAAFHKIGRRSSVPSVCGGVTISPEHIDLGTTTYQIDSRAVVIPATKGRVMQHRPRLNNWKARFHIEYEERLFPGPEILHSILDDAGTLVGVGAFRPEKHGPFGRFVVTSWKS
jgi:hypothetical protein